MLESGLMRPLILLLLCNAAWAAPVRWTLSGVLLSSPDGTASGSFVYDADTNTYSNVDITTTAFTILVDSVPVAVPGNHYTAVGSGTTGSYLLTTASGGALVLLFAQPLTNAGGTIGFLQQAQILPPAFFFSGESVNAGPLVHRSITDGAVTASPTPVSIPTLSQTGLLILGVLLAVCAAKGLHRRTLTEIS